MPCEPDTRSFPHGDDGSLGRLACWRGPLGAAVAAAVSAGSAEGGYDSWTGAQDRMTTLKEKRFEPDPWAQAVYNELYAIYRELHDGFGGVAGPGVEPGRIMKRLLAVRDRATVSL